MDALIRQRLEQQIAFIVEIDKAKAILRTSKHIHGEVLENDAEHSWYLAMMAVVLAEYAGETVDITRVIRMVLIHDLVEIDAGDTDAYDQDGQNTRVSREQLAAQRVFGLLPDDIGDELRELWEEFEARETADAKFAAALDRMPGILLGAHRADTCWNDRAIDEIKARHRPIGDASTVLWEYAEGVIDRFARNRTGAA